MPGPCGRSRARALTRTNHTKRNSAYAERAAGRRQRCSRHEFNLSLTKQRIERAVGPTFFRSAARGLHVPAARCAASRKTRRGSAGPTNGRASAAAKSWPARPLPFAQNGRIVQLKITIFVSWVVELCRSTLNVHPLRGESDNSLPKACLTRERGARECRASGPSRARALTRTIHSKRNSTYRKRAAGRRQRCSRHEFNPICDETEI